MSDENITSKWYEYDDPNEVDFIGTKFIKPDYDIYAYSVEF